MSVATLRNRLALHRFVCVEFGYEDLDEMLGRLRPARGELVAGGGSDYALALAPLPARARVMADQLADYDANITAHSGRLRMTGEHGRTWKPHQYPRDPDASDASRLGERANELERHLHGAGRSLRIPCGGRTRSRCRPAHAH